MINLLSHIAHTIEAPFLDSILPVTKDTVTAELEDGQYRAIDLDTNDNKIKFGASVSGFYTSLPIRLEAGGTITWNASESTGASAIAIIKSASDYKEGGFGNIVCVRPANEKGSLTYKAECFDCYVVLMDRMGLCADEYTITFDAKRIVYYAFLEDEETGVKTDAVMSRYQDPEDGEEPSNDNTLVYFKFDPHAFSAFEDKAKLSLYIYNENYEEAWWKKKAYKLIKTKIECEDEQTE